MQAKSRARFFFLLPGVIWLLCFTLFPLVYSLGISFTNMRMGRANRVTEFIGLENYAEAVLGDDKIAAVLETSLFLIVGSVLLTLLLGTFIAWLFNHDIPGLRTFRAILTLPLFAAPIALGFLGLILFNEQSGPINYMLAGLGFDTVYWIINPWAARVAVLITDVWQWTPFVFIVVLAAMQSIPDELFEAARLDTSSAWSLFRNITFPMITPALGTVAILRLVETFKILDIPRALTQGGPGIATQTYSYYVYLEGIGKSFRMGYSSALAWLLVIVAIIITNIYFWRVRERFEAAS